ncbi:hypothetical protein [Paraflavitalea speifideaquila]|uniref:hypothetical protein n=1 Tax=Paraflavitalea speifideaquila TaxID=3076558 RepID=UPI0028E656C9|nr:hypothetical protein [Paraflavitalea speifideiaquila]
MKQGIILAFFLPLAVATYSQQTPLDDKTRLQKLKKDKFFSIPSMENPLVYKLPAQDTTKADLFRKLVEAQRLSKGGLMAGTYSHRALNGKIYTLQPDNMPCLVPDMKSVATMPIAGQENLDPMNIWPKKKVIPEGKEK